MSNQRRSRKDDDIPVNLPLRQNLPRRCKDIQPCYSTDIEIQDIEDRRKMKKKRGFTSCSSSKMGREQGVITKQEQKMEEILLLTIFSWLIDMKVVKDYEMIHSLNGTHRGRGQGVVTRLGILCCCCEEIFSAYDFQFHSGDFSGDKPFQKMFVVGTSISLLTCIIEAWNRHSVPARDGYHHVSRRPRVRDNYDDSCVICADGGDLLCCEKCPSTYHPKCLGFEGVPQDEWHCPYCHCKYCDRDASCALLLTCFQCLKKYHWQCSEVIDKIPLDLPPTIPFCGKSCWQLYQILEGMVGRSKRLQPGIYWTLVRRMDLDVAGHEPSRDLHSRAKCNSMVALAAKLMEDSFKLIVDRQTRTNMIQSVVYNCGSNFTRTNFSRFYTAVLESHGHIVTVASLRMPSSKLAEIPFIATNESWRNRGMCRYLLLAIESELAEIGVERIVIPSAEDMVRNWQEKFGFIAIDNSVKKEITTLNTLMFPRTTRLQKVINNPSRRMIINDLNLPPAED